jgi:hypothetical protein
MDFNNKHIQQQYEGFLDTPLLWNNSFYGLQQIQLTTISSHIFEGELTKNTRLGKRVESFVSCYLQKFDNISMLQENIQIQHNKITVGELDCILLQENNPIHLEVVFKFYLYDKTVGSTELEHWIGPNRNDSLHQKVEKLSTKQLPLLFKNETKKYIDLDIEIIQQKVLFKAQLFVPYSNQNIEFDQLNPDCFAGFYINKEELEQFTSAKFYIPTKLDWLVQPHSNVPWLTYNQFKEETDELLKGKKSPLCWMKQPNGEISKFFLVWWHP